MLHFVCEFRTGLNLRAETIDVAINRLYPNWDTFPAATQKKLRDQLIGEVYGARTRRDKERFQEKIWELFPPTDAERRKFQRKMDMEERQEKARRGDVLEPTQPASTPAPPAPGANPTPTVPPVGIATTTPEAPISRWEDVRLLLGESMALDVGDFWKPGKVLTSQEEMYMRQVHGEQPMGQQDFETWLRVTLPQALNEYIARQRLPAPTPELVGAGR